MIKTRLALLIILLVAVAFKSNWAVTTFAVFIALYVEFLNAHANLKVKQETADRKKIEYRLFNKIKRLNRELEHFKKQSQDYVRRNELPKPAKEKPVYNRPEDNGTGDTADTRS